MNINRKNSKTSFAALAMGLYAPYMEAINTNGPIVIGGKKKRPTQIQKPKRKRHPCGGKKGKK